VSGATGWLLGGAALWAVVAGCWITETRKHLRNRRLDREARERRDAHIGASIAALRPEPLTDGKAAAEFFASLAEAPRSSSSEERSR
jgi:hypothetical protein